MKHQGWGFKKVALYIILPLFFLSGIFITAIAFIVYTKAHEDLPDVLTLKNYKPNLITEVYDDNNKLI